MDGNNETTRVRLLTVAYPSCCKLWPGAFSVYRTGPA